MRKTILITLTLISGVLTANAQRDMTPGSRKAAFGKTDTRLLTNKGIQLTFGPTYQFTNATNKTREGMDSLGSRYNYIQDPQGKIGFHIDLGMAIIPVKDPSIKFLKKRIISMYDWGVAFKYLGGSEKTTFNYTDALGNTLFSETGEGKFYHGYLGARVTAYHFDYIGKTIFISNGLGINVDYRLLENGGNYSSPVLPSTQRFQKELVAQIHYDFGIGFRLKRGVYLIPGVQVPVIGVYEWNNFNPSLHWFSSSYWPALFKIKYVKLLEKKAKGCPAVGTSDSDKQREKEFRQGN